MTIMIRDGLKMGAGGCRWIYMNANGFIGVHAFGGTRKQDEQRRRGHGLRESMTHGREIFRMSCLKVGAQRKHKGDTEPRK